MIGLSPVSVLLHLSTKYSHRFSAKRNPTAIEDYSIMNEQNEQDDFIRHCVGVQLLKRDHEKSDIVRFNVVYTPNRLQT